MITGTGEFDKRYEESEPTNVALFMLKPRDPTTTASTCSVCTAFNTASRTSSDSTQTNVIFAKPAFSNSLFAQSRRYLATA